MATVTVTYPKVVYAGADSFYVDFIEANSTSLAALRLVTLNTGVPPKWVACASDPATILGTNIVAGVNLTTGLVATPIHVFVPGTIIEINSNATGTDPLIGTAYGLVVSTNDHQLDYTDTTNDVFIPIRQSPKDTALDTNIRMWVKIDPAVLLFNTGL